MPTGTVKFFSKDKGYGFIVPEGGGPDVFCHVKDLRSSGLDDLRPNQRVNYEIAPGASGKGPKAVSIRSA